MSMEEMAKTLLDKLESMEKRLDAMLNQLKEIKENMATKEDMKKISEMLATISEKMVTKQDLAKLATKQDLEKLATREDVMSLTVKAQQVRSKWRKYM